MSTSANACAVATSPHCRFGEVRRSRRPRCARSDVTPVRNAARASSSAAGAVARARVLEPPVDDRDHACPCPATRRAAAAPPARRTAGRRRADDRPSRVAERADAREQRGERTRTAVDPPRTHGQAAHPRTDFDRPDRTRSRARAPRAPRASRRRPRAAPCRVPIRRLAPPVSSTPAICRVTCAVQVSRRPRRPGAANSRRPSSRSRVSLEQYVVADARALAASRG